MTHHSDDQLDLTSMYLDLPSGRPHFITLHLGPEHGGVRRGTISLDPNHCGLNEWGDRGACTRMGWTPLDVTATRMRTLDPAGHGRILHQLTSHHAGPVSGEQELRASLIEYPLASLWYLVYPQKDGSAVIPLFAADLFNPAGVINMRYGAPMRGVLERGDAQEMRAEVEAVDAALAAIDAEPSARGRVRNDRLDDIRSVLAELKAALARLEG